MFFKDFAYIVYYHMKMWLIFLHTKQVLFVSGILNLNPLSANPTKWSNTLKQFFGNLPTNCLSVFDHFLKLALKGLNEQTRLLRLSNEVNNQPFNGQYSHHCRAYCKANQLTGFYVMGILVVKGLSKSEIITKFRF